MNGLKIVALAIVGYALLGGIIGLLIAKRHELFEKIKDIFSSREGRLTVLKVLGILILVAALIAGFIFVTKPYTTTRFSIRIDGVDYELERIENDIVPWREETEIEGVRKTEYSYTFVGGNEDTSIKVCFSYDLWEENGKERIGVNAPAIYINGEYYSINTNKAFSSNGYLTNKKIWCSSLGKEYIAIDIFSLPYSSGYGKDEIYFSGYFEIHLYDDELFDWLYHADFF